MNSVAMKFFSRHGFKTLKTVTYNSIRLGSDDKCPPVKECTTPPPTPTCKSTPPIPPCPTMSGGASKPSGCPPPSVCTTKSPSCNTDPNNPCNYVAPPCKDPSCPDLTKLKKLQCKYQEENGLPIYLKGGTSDVILYHTTLILTGVTLLLGVYDIVRLF